MAEKTEPEETSDVPALPSMAGAAISVLLLAHNARADVDAVLTSWLKQLEQLERDHEIIVVDDGSTDSTAEVVQRIAQGNAKVKFHRHDTRQGDGAALKTGIAAVRHPLLFYTTCDRQYQAVDLHLLLAEIDKVHMISGYRRWQAVQGWVAVVGKLWRFLAWLLFSVQFERLAGWLGWRDHLHAVFMRIMFGLRLRDTRCQFRLFRRALFERIPLQSHGPFVHDEVLAKANFLGALMSDAPIQYRPRTDKIARPAESWWSDFRRVFFHPNFGPTHLGQGSHWGVLGIG